MKGLHTFSHLSASSHPPSLTPRGGRPLVETSTCTQLSTPTTPSLNKKREKETASSSFSTCPHSPPGPHFIGACTQWRPTPRRPIGNQPPAHGLPPGGIGCRLRAISQSEDGIGPRLPGRGSDGSVKDRHQSMGT